MSDVYEDPDAGDADHRAHRALLDQKPFRYTRHAQDWDDTDSLALVFALAIPGISMGQIAVALGKTRNAVIGRAARIRALELRLTQRAEALQQKTSNGG